MSILTKQAIRDSFQEMLHDRPFKQITVRDIAQDCGINRKTFYYYYSDIYALAEDYFHTIVNKITDLYPSTGTQWVEGMKALLVYFQEHKKIAMNMYRSMDYAVLENTLFNAILEYSTIYITKKTEGRNISEVDRQYISEFIATAIAGSIMRWAGNGMTGEPAAIIDRYVGLCGSMLNFLAANVSELVDTSLIV